MIKPIDSGQLLAQLRAMEAMARGDAPKTEQPGAGGFGSMLAEAASKVNDAQQHAGDLKRAFELGEPGVELPQVMIATQKAGVSFQALVHVRNHLLTAYKDIMNMPI